MKSTKTMAAESLKNGRSKQGGRPFANTRAAVEAEVAAAAPQGEARLAIGMNVLLVLAAECPDGELARAFFGSVILMSSPDTPTVDPSELSGKTVYMCGDISWASTQSVGSLLGEVYEVLVIGPLSSNYDPEEVSVVGTGRVPICVQGVGVLYRHFFDMDNVYDKVQQEHQFQQITDPNKPGKGIYLTPITKDKEGDLSFRLLRSSTTLSGPTDNFRNTDNQIVDSLNQEAARLFDNPALLNHVLAQVDENEQSTTSHNGKSSDKTKDMPTNGIVAFSTFYNQLGEPLQRNSTRDPFDWVQKDGTSALSRLKFRLKDQVMQRGSPLVSSFLVTLYPNSVFFMPLSTNRLYNHQVSQSALPSKLRPKRLGYVVRCSATEAVHRREEQKTFVRQPAARGKRPWEAMEPATQDRVKKLKLRHEQEDTTEKPVDYRDLFHISMNKGDYTQPNYQIQDDFRVVSLDLPPNLFSQLSCSVSFEDTNKGRRAVILDSDPEEGTPIVRTTTKFTTPSQCFQTLHHQLADAIRNAASLTLQLNNALVEICDNQSVELGFRGHQAQDLAKGSCIALFSCYKHAHAPSRKLVVESKTKEEGGFEIPLPHNSVVLWSLETNGRFRHKVVLDRSQGEPEDNTWLGFTFRTSKTLIQYRQEEGDTQTRAFFADSGMPLLLLEGDACSSIYKLRKLENEAIGFEYPPIITTISRSDRLPPVLLPLDQTVDMDIN